MKTRRNLIGVALMVVSLAGAWTAYGEPGHKRGGHHFGHRDSAFPFRVLKALDLTTEQQKQIETIREARRETFKTLYTDLRTANDEVTNKLLTPGEVTSEQLTGHADRIAALQTQLAKEQLAMGLEMRNVLTPDQLTKAADLIAKKKTLREEWKNPSKEEGKKSPGAEQ